MRLIRWIRMGELTRNPPITMLAGLANSSNIGASLPGGPEGHAMVQEFRQGGVEVIAGLDELVVDALASAAAADLDEVLLQRLEVAVAQGTRIAEQIGQLFHSFELRRAGKRETQLVVVHYVEDEHVVAAVAEHFQAAEERLAVA